MKRDGAAYYQAVRYMASAGMNRVIVTLEDTEHDGYTDAHPATVAATFEKTGATETVHRPKLAELVWRAAQDIHGPIVPAVAVAMNLPGSGVELIQDVEDAA